MLQQRKIRKVKKAVYVDCTPRTPPDDTCGLTDFIVFFAFMVFLFITLPGFF